MKGDKRKAEKDCMRKECRVGLKGGLPYRSLRGILAHKFNNVVGLAITGLSLGDFKEETERRVTQAGVTRKL